MMTAIAEYDRRRWPFVSVLGLLGPTTSDRVEIQTPQISPPSTAGSPEWLNTVINRMTELSQLRRNWDGRGSSEVSADAIVFALTILQRVMPPAGKAPSIVPLGGGGLQLVWHKFQSELEVEVLAPNNAIIFYSNGPRGTENEWNATTDFSALAAILEADFRT
jgi:hypothetical protein